MKLEEKESDINVFLENNPNTHFLQSPQWAKVKENWENETIVIRDDNQKIKGIANILLRKVPIINKYIMYSPRGFTCDIKDKTTIEEITKQIKIIAKKYNAFIFRTDPDVKSDNTEFKSLMKSLGYNQKKKSKKCYDDIVQPKYVFRLNIKDKTEEELLKSFKEKTRYNIRLAKRKGVIVRNGEEKDLGIFYKILVQTSLRDKFNIRDFTYYKKIFTEMGNKHVKIFIAEYNNTPIAASMAIMYGNKVWYLYGGSTNEYRNYMPNYLMQWEMIKWALENKCEIYDFRGVSGYNDPKNPQYGIYKFKKGFNGDFIEFMDEFYIVFNPLINFLYEICGIILTKFIGFHNL